MSRRLLLALFFAFALVAAGCGNDDDGSDSGTDSDGTSETTDSGSSDDGTDDNDGGADDDDEPAASGGGGGGAATITVDGETWTFDSVQCAFGEDEIGQEGAELVVSAIQDGLQFYVDISSFGNSISIDDIEDFENPSVAWSAAEVIPGDEVTIDIDGKNISGGSDAFRDSSDDALPSAEGTFEATCP